MFSHRNFLVAYHVFGIASPPVIDEYLGLVWSVPTITVWFAIDAKSSIECLRSYIDDTKFVLKGKKLQIILKCRITSATFQKFFQ